MKKFLIGVVLLLVLAVGGVCLSTGLVVRKGAEFVAQNYNIGVEYGSASGTPFTSYQITDIKLTRDGEKLFEAGKILVDPALLKLITGKIALDWVELTDIKSTIPDVLKLAEIFTGSMITLPDAIPLNDIVLNSVGGNLDGSDASASVDLVLNGLPIKGEFKLSLANGVTVESGSVQMAGGTIDASGAVMPELDVKATANKLQIADFSALVPQIKSFAAKGVLSVNLTAKGALDNPTVNGTVTFEDGSAMGFPISAQTTVALEDMKVDLNPLSVSAIGIPVGGSVSADLKQATPTLNVNIKTDGPVTAAVLRENLPTLPADLGGQVDGVSVSVTGPVTGLSGNAEVKAAKLTFSGQSITDTLLKAAFDSKGVITLSGSSNIVGNPATLKGTVNTGGKEVAADVALNIKNFDLAILPKLVPSAPANIKGKVNAALTVKGKGSAITAGGQIDSQRVSLNDMNIDKIKVPVTISGDTLTFRDASLVFMDLPISKVNGSITYAGDNLAFKEMSAVVANGSIKMNSTLVFGKNLNGTYDLNISQIDLGNIMKTYGAGNLGASGKLGGSVKGALTDTDITGDGSLSIPSFTMMGLKFEQIKTNVKLSKMIASLSDFGCKFAGGSIGGSMSVDINNMTYSLKTNLKGSQLKQIIDAMAPTLGGGLTGTLTGDYSASGKLNPFSLNGNGTVSSAGGQLYGFSKYKSIIDLLAKLHGSKTISYANAKIPFATSLDKLTLQDGTVINASSGDGIYQYIKAKGTFAYSGALNMDAEGSLNAMLINTAASALSGAVTAGGAATLLSGGLGGIAGLATGAVSGAKTSWGKNDFKTLAFHIGGSVDNPKLSNFKVNGSTWDKSAAEKENSKLLNSSTVDNVKQKATEQVNKALNKTSSSKSTSSSSVNDQINKAVGKGLNSLLGGKKKK